MATLLTHGPCIHHTHPSLLHWRTKCKCLMFSELHLMGGEVHCVVCNVSVSRFFSTSESRPRKASPSQDQHGILCAHFLFLCRKHLPLPRSTHTWAASTACLPGEGLATVRISPRFSLSSAGIWQHRHIYLLHLPGHSFFLFKSPTCTLLRSKGLYLGWGWRGTFWPQSQAKLSILNFAKICPIGCKFLVVILIQVNSLFLLINIKIGKHY